MSRTNRDHRSSRRSSQRTYQDYEDEAGPSWGPDPEDPGPTPRYEDQPLRHDARESRSSGSHYGRLPYRLQEPQIGQTNDELDKSTRAKALRERSLSDWMDAGDKLFVSQRASRTRQTRDPGPATISRSATQDETLFLFLNADGKWAESTGFHDRANNATNLISASQIFSLGYTSQDVDLDGSRQFEGSGGNYWSLGTIELDFSLSEALSSRRSFFHVVDNADLRDHDIVFSSDYKDHESGGEIPSIAVGFWPKVKPSKRTKHEQKRKLNRREEEAREEEDLRRRRRERDRRQQRNPDQDDRTRSAQQGKKPLYGGGLPSLPVPQEPWPGYGGPPQGSDGRPDENDGYDPYPRPPGTTSRRPLIRSGVQDYPENDSTYPAGGGRYTDNNPTSSRLPEPTTRQTSLYSIPPDPYSGQNLSYPPLSDPYSGQNLPYPPPSDPYSGQNLPNPLPSDPYSGNPSAYPAPSQQYAQYPPPAPANRYGPQPTQDPRLRQVPVYPSQQNAYPDPSNVYYKETRRPR